jgi:hypothetical protein
MELGFDGPVAEAFEVSLHRWTPSANDKSSTLDPEIIRQTGLSTSASSLVRWGQSDAPGCTKPDWGSEVSAKETDRVSQGLGQPFDLDPGPRSAKSHSQAGGEPSRLTGAWSSLRCHAKTIWRILWEP